MTHRHGFTRIEALIFIVVVAILAWTVVPGCGSQGVVGPEAPPPDRELLQREADLRATLQEVRDAVGLFLSDTGAYPWALSDITKPASEPPEVGLNADGCPVDINASDYKGPYMTTACGGGLPCEPLHGYKNWVYATVMPDVGGVFVQCMAMASDGTYYSTW